MYLTDGQVTTIKEYISDLLVDIKKDYPNHLEEAFKFIFTEEHTSENFDQLMTNASNLPGTIALNHLHEIYNNIEQAGIIKHFTFVQNKKADSENSNLSDSEIRTLCLKEIRGQMKGLFQQMITETHENELLKINLKNIQAECQNLKLENTVLHAISIENVRLKEKVLQKEAIILEEREKENKWLEEKYFLNEKITQLTTTANSTKGDLEAEIKKLRTELEKKESTTKELEDKLQEEIVLKKQAESENTILKKKLDELSKKSADLRNQLDQEITVRKNLYQEKSVPKSFDFQTIEPLIYKIAVCALEHFIITLENKQKIQALFGEIKYDETKEKCSTLPEYNNLFERLISFTHMFRTKKSINCKDSSGFTLLFFACAFNDVDSVKKLLEADALIIPVQRGCCLNPAIDLNNMEIIRLLVENKYEEITLLINSKAIDSPFLPLGKFFQNLELIELLLKHNIHKEEFELQLQFISDINLIKLFLSYGIELSSSNMPEFISNTQLVTNSLDFAAYIGDIELCEQILARNPDQNITQALYLGIIKPRFDIVDVLLKKVNYLTKKGDFAYNGFKILENILLKLNDDKKLQFIAIRQLLNNEAFILSSSEYESLFIRALQVPELCIAFLCSKFLKKYYHELSNSIFTLLQLLEEQSFIELLKITLVKKAAPILLYYAIKFGYKERARYIIQECNNWDFLYENDMQPLHFAILHDQEILVAEILQKKPNLLHKSKLGNPLMVSLTCENDVIIQLICIELNKLGKEIVPCVHDALIDAIKNHQSDRISVIFKSIDKEALKKAIDINLLLAAGTYNNLEAIQLILETNIDLAGQCHPTLTFNIMDVAQLNNYHELIKYLELLNIPPSYPLKFLDRENTIFGHSTKDIDPNHLEFILKCLRHDPFLTEYIAEKKIDINYALPESRITPLMLAAIQQNLPAVKFLLSKGARKEQMDCLSRTAYDYATIHHQQDVQELLWDNNLKQLVSSDRNHKNHSTQNGKRKHDVLINNSSFFKDNTVDEKISDSTKDRSPDNASKKNKSNPEGELNVSEEKQLDASWFI